MIKIPEPRKFRTEKARARYKRVMVMRLLVFGTFFLIVFALIVSFFYIPAFRITTVEVHGNSQINAEDIEAITVSELRGTYGYLFPRSNIFLYSEEDIEQALIRAHPRIATVETKAMGLRVLRVSVSERTAAALWCGDIVPLVDFRSAEENSSYMGTCYYMDAQGYIFERAPNENPELFVRYYGALDRGEPLGQYFVPQEEFTRLQAFTHALKDSGLSPAALLIVDEIDAQLYLTSGPTVFFNRTQDPGEVATNLLTVVTAESLKNMLSNIEYIDLRFGNKVYYRLIEPSL